MSASALRPILVTGGNKGIGKAICSKLLKDYPNDAYVLLGSRDAERGQQAIQELKEEHGEDCLLKLVIVDTGSDESVQQAAKAVETLLEGKPLYAICNNAGIHSSSHEETINVNYFGPRRVNEALSKLLQRPGGRIVNLSSAAGPMFVGDWSPDASFSEQLTRPWTIPNGIAGLDEICKTFLDKHKLTDQGAYGLSKAALSAYTWLLAQEEKGQLIVNAVTPGFIATDMTARYGASNPPSVGAVPPVYLLMDEEVAQKPGGRFYGSDCQRSPWHEYREPGSPPYDGPDGP